MAAPSGFSKTLALFFAAAVIIFSSSRAAVVAGGDAEQQLVRWLQSRSDCRGTIADCLADGDEEFGLDSEVSRRILATTKYISYAALQRNSVPCSRRGASYYNCQSGAQANPYSRGCNAITRCRS